MPAPSVPFNALPRNAALTPAAQQRRLREHAVKVQAQADCLEHHAQLVQRLACMSVEERRLCYGLPPAPVRRLRTLPGMRTLALQGVAARVNDRMRAQAHEPVPELPRVITATWRALWITGRSLALTFGGRAPA